MSSVLLDSRHRFATSWDVLENFRERTGASSFSISGLASSLIESKDSGEELLALAIWQIVFAFSRLHHLYKKLKTVPGDPV